MKPFSSYILKDFQDDFNSKYGIFLNFSASACSVARAGNLNPEVKGMVRGRKDPSSAAVSAASMKGNADRSKNTAAANGRAKISNIKKTTWNNMLRLLFGAAVIF